MNEDDLTAPGREMQRRLRGAMRGRSGAFRELLERLRLLFAAEERWLYPEFAAGHGEGRRAGWLQRLAGQHHCMLGLIDRLLQLGPQAAETPALLATLQAMLAAHVREERALLGAGLEAGLADPFGRLARFSERAWRTIAQGGLEPAPYLASGTGVGRGAR